MAKETMDAKGSNTATETFDTPIPEELRARYDAWYAQLPKNLQYTGDYDLQGAWLERLGRPDRYEATQNGHLDDYGKKPNHITFSTGSKWHDPKVPERTGGEWRQAKDGSWDFYPGTGNKASDDELKAYFEKYEKGNRVHRREVRQDAKGGDAPGPETAVSETPVSEDIPPEPGGASVSSPAEGGPRIVINPTTFHNDKDAACVMWNEGFRIVMEDMQFDPVAEPTERQRRFFSDTAYADDETQLRRTILARICTFDTSVKDPTDEQLEEAVEFLEDVMEAGIPQNEWEQSSVQRIHDVIVQSVGRRPAGGTSAETPAEPAAAEPAEETQADEQGGETEESGADEAAPAENEATMLGLDMAESNDVFQFDPYSGRKEDGEQEARDEAADIIGPMALKRDDATEKKAPGTPGAWDGSMKQIGPQTTGTYNSRSPNFRGGAMSPGSWDGSFRQTGDAYKRR